MYWAVSSLVFNAEPQDSSGDVLSYDVSLLRRSTRLSCV